MNGLLCFERIDKQTNNKLIGKIDTGIQNNYILKDKTKHAKLIKFKRSFLFNGFKITHFVRINLFSHDLVFCVMDYIENFDLILGTNGLRKMKSIIDVMSFRMTYENTRREKYNAKKQKIEGLIETS